MYYLAPDISKVHLLVVYFNSGKLGASHIGLGVNALHTLKVLRRVPIRVDSIAVSTHTEIMAALAKDPTITHCLIEAPWVSTANIQTILSAHPHVHVIVRIHSQLGFLQVEAGAIRLIREQLLLQEHVLNFSVAANSKKLVEFVESVYQARCLYLPNLYDLVRTTPHHHAPHDHRLLRVSSWGALRILKNHSTAAAAALMIAKDRGSDLEFFINSNREEHGKGVVDALRNMFAKVPWARLVEVPWSDWATFRRTVSTMNLCAQTSLSETFNLASADAAAEGIPSVVSPAIEWLPAHFQADPDSVGDVARVGSMLLSSKHAGREAYDALSVYVNEALRVWLRYLECSPTH